MLFDKKKKKQSSRPRRSSEEEWDDEEYDEYDDEYGDDYDDEYDDYDDLDEETSMASRGRKSERKSSIKDMELPTWLLGRKDPCDILFDDVSVSRKHCQIVETADGYGISDLASANGTYINGVRIHGEVPLFEGDKVQLGKVRFTFRKQMLRGRDD